jgi:hypothetical protein
MVVEPKQIRRDAKLIVDHQNVINVTTYLYSSLNEW